MTIALIRPKVAKVKNEIFEGITSRHVNQYYSGIVKGLSAKVFRTYLATSVVKKYLVEHDTIKTKTANEKHFEGLKDYRASEGRTVLVPYKGPIQNTIQDVSDLNNNFKLGSVDSLFISKSDSLSYSESDSVLNISLLLPFYLDLNDSLSFDSESSIYSKSKIALDYYFGALIALDTLSKTIYVSVEVSRS